MFLLARFFAQEKFTSALNVNAAVPGGIKPLHADHEVLARDLVHRVPLTDYFDTKTLHGSKRTRSYYAKNKHRQIHR